MADSSGLLSYVPLVGPALQTGLDYLTGSTPSQLAEQQYNNSRQLASYQNDLNMQSWQKQQDYNTPANQMARFKAAGLNPNLIYGQGNPGNAASPVELSAGVAKQARPSSLSTSFANMLPAALGYLDVQAKLKDLRLMDDDHDLKQAQVDAVRTNVFDKSFTAQLHSLAWQREQGRSRFYQESTERENILQKYSAQIQQQKLNEMLRQYSVEKQFAVPERALDLERSRRENELEKYTQDPRFYYGERALDKVLQLVPRFNLKTRGMSEDQMINTLRGRGHSVRRGVYGQ